MQSKCFISLPKEKNFNMGGEIMLFFKKEKSGVGNKHVTADKRQERYIFLQQLFHQYLNNTFIQIVLVFKWSLSNCLRTGIYLLSIGIFVCLFHCELSLEQKQSLFRYRWP